MRPVRNTLLKMGIPVEGSKGEAEAGQEEINIKYADAMSTADHHIFINLYGKMEPMLFLMQIKILENLN